MTAWENILEGKGIDPQKVEMGNYGQTQWIFEGIIGCTSRTNSDPRFPALRRFLLLFDGNPRFAEVLVPNVSHPFQGNFDKQRILLRNFLSCFPSSSTVKVTFLTSQLLIASRDKLREISGRRGKKWEPLCKNSQIPLLFRISDRLTG
jgi:hypothetical protein